MKMLLKLIVLTAVLAPMATIRAQSEQLGRESKPSFSIHISISENVVKAGTEVELKIVVTNISSHIIFTSRSNGKDQAELSYYAFDVRDAKGASAPETKYSRVLRGADQPQAPDTRILNRSDVLFQLPPGETLNDEMIINKLFDLSRTGKYTIQVQKADRVSGTAVKSNTITLAIVP